MAPTYHLLAVEQPELHVHPAVQCRLADVLALQVVGKERILLLETHSEHLMLRLLRRIRETADDELPEGAPALHPEDISVIYVSQNESGAEITLLPVNAEGNFDRRWPKGFFNERTAEVFS
jgi:predicted ATPase